MSVPTLETIVIPAITPEEVKQYAVASGDHNPIHTDRRVAEKAGLAGLPVQGMLIMGLVSHYLEEWAYCERIKRLEVRFVSPALIDLDLSLSARVVLQPKNQPYVILRISVKQLDKIVSVGEADIVLRKEPGIA